MVFVRHSNLSTPSAVTAAVFLRCGLCRSSFAWAGVRGGRLARRAALLSFQTFDLGGLEVTPLAYQNPFGGDGADADAGGLDGGVADRIEHAADLLVAPLAEDDLVPGVRLPLVGLRDLRGRCLHAVVEAYAAAQARHLLLGRHALDLHLVDLLDVVARRRDVVSQLAVVGQDEQALRVEVQTADRVQTP